MFGSKESKEAKIHAKKEAARKREAERKHKVMEIQGLLVNKPKITNTGRITGFQVIEEIGMISATAVVSIGAGKQLASGLGMVAGGNRNTSLEAVVVEGRKLALADLRKIASDVGADAVLNVKADFYEVGAGNNKAPACVLTGTAVRLLPDA
jgi:uncharacterized protein YbjQ (UPF0145 family)